MSAKNQLKLLIKDHIQPSLKKSDFRKKGMVFWRQDGNCISALEIVVGDNNGVDKVDFTIEAGTYFPSVINAITKIPRFAFIGPPKIPPNDSTFMVSARIGELADNGDQWWRIGQHSDIRSVGETLEDAITKTLLPWLDRNCDIAESIKTLKQKVIQQDFMSAVYMLGLAKEAGQPEDCEFAVQVILDNPLIKGKDRNDIKDWAKSTL
ncbi:DUF4304 domain-containing protein [Gilvimarinus algae]|uniref:DUF4304 domain-containing protein n=1 Tax=Gilvimarinus algae TaxID=3058037 RepID=A0ABT8TF43_9GAMM|nr:DUF4304 domain-containing protein [Gilvimarinus sp. SDUM040014]MDO3382013.1 DUF4304 domain-containing protein [Gilvimarinus sp. SDUM040014]